MILIIDGNFFANRIRSAAGSQSSTDLSFTDNPEYDRQVLMYELTKSLCAQVRKLPEVTKVIIAKDFSSWRKDHVAILPDGGWKDDKDPTYKANRADKEKPFDAKLFFKAYEDWVNVVDSKLRIPVVTTHKAEADDICAILAQVYEKNNQNVLLWTSDGDYVQNLSKKIFLLKFPQYQLWVDSSMAGLEQNIFTANENVVFHTLAEKFKKKDIVWQNPTLSILSKIIYGDSKDNVPPSFYWKNGKGGIRKPSSSFVEKAFDELLMNVDHLKKSDLYDMNLISKLYMHLFYVTKNTKGIDFKAKSKTREHFDNPETLYLHYVDNVDAAKQLEHVLKVYTSNMKMKVLDFKQIPKNIVNDVLAIMQKKQHYEHNIDLLKNFDKTIKMMDVITPEKKSEFFEKFNLAEIKSTANSSTEKQQFEAITMPTLGYDPLDNILNELNINIEI